MAVLQGAGSPASRAADPFPDAASAGPSLRAPAPAPAADSRSLDPASRTLAGALADPRLRATAPSADDGPQTLDPASRTLASAFADPLLRAPAPSADDGPETLGPASRVADALDGPLLRAPFSTVGTLHAPEARAAVVFPVAEATLLTPLESGPAEPRPGEALGSTSAGDPGGLPSAPSGASSALATRALTADAGGRPLGAPAEAPAASRAPVVPTDATLLVPTRPEGPSAGGSAAGGSAAGRSAAGRSAGGSAAGWSAAGGSAAGGSATSDPASPGFTPTGSATLASPEPTTPASAPGASPVLEGAGRAGRGAALPHAPGVLHATSTTTATGADARAPSTAGRTHAAPSARHTAGGQTDTTTLTAGTPTGLAAGRHSDGARLTALPRQTGPAQRAQPLSEPATPDPAPASGLAVPHLAHPALAARSGPRRRVASDTALSHVAPRRRSTPPIARPAADTPTGPGRRLTPAHAPPATAPAGPHGWLAAAAATATAPAGPHGWLAAAAATLSRAARGAPTLAASSALLAAAQVLIAAGAAARANPGPLPTIGPVALPTLASAVENVLREQSHAGDTEPGPARPGEHLARSATDRRLTPSVAGFAFTTPDGRLAYVAPDSLHAARPAPDAARPPESARLHPAAHVDAARLVARPASATPDAHPPRPADAAHRHARFDAARLVAPGGRLTHDAAASLDTTDLLTRPASAATPSPGAAAPDGAAPDGAAPDGAAPDGAAPDGGAPHGAAPRLDATTPAGLTPSHALLQPGLAPQDLVRPLDAQLHATGTPQARLRHLEAHLRDDSDTPKSPDGTRLLAPGRPADQTRAPTAPTTAAHTPPRSAPPTAAILPFRPRAATQSDDALPLPHRAAPRVDGRALVDGAGAPFATVRPPRPQAPPPAEEPDQARMTASWEAPAGARTARATATLEPQAVAAPPIAEPPAPTASTPAGRGLDALAEEEMVAVLRALSRRSPEVEGLLDRIARELDNRRRMDRGRRIA